MSLKDDLAAAIGPIADAYEADIASQKTSLTESIAALSAQLAALQPEENKTKFGACPEKPGGTSVAVQQIVITKWGAGAAVRVFLATQAAARHQSASIVHCSWKPTAAQITPAWVQSVTATLKDGDVVEVWHEADKKVSDGILTFTDVVARKNRFYEIVKQVRPGLLVANTLTGWLLDPKSGKNVDQWGSVAADVLGVDCDGVRPTALPYTNYDDETTRALAFIQKFKAAGYKWFSVPEFGCPRIVAADPNGTVRAAYHEKYAKLWAESGKCLYATLYEYDSSPNYSLTTTAEINQWRARVASGA